MIKTKDGYDITVGDALSDTTGIYEVKNITSRYVELKEMCFDDDGDLDHYGDERTLLHSEIGNMYYE